LDYQLSSPEANEIILGLALHYGRLFNASVIEVPEKVAKLMQSSLFGRILLQRKERIYQCHPKTESSPLAGTWQEIEFHLYDGDMAFS